MLNTSVFRKLFFYSMLSFLIMTVFVQQKTIAKTQTLLHSKDQSSLKAIKEKVICYLIGNSDAGTYHKKAVQKNDNTVETILKNPFQPITWDISEELGMNNKLNDLAIELKTLAIAFCSEGSQYEKSPQVKERIAKAMTNILQYWNPSTPRPGNWYPWLITLPTNLGTVGLLMETYLEPELISRLRITLRDQLTDRPVLTGTNAAWESRAHIYLALLDKDLERLGKAAEYVFQTVRFGTEQGVREDYCYLFHGHIPYAGGYGAGFTETIAEFIYLFDGTPWAIEDRHRNIVVNLLLEHTRWFLSGGKVDLLVRGRSYSQQNNASSLLKALLTLAQVHGPKRGEIARTAVAILEAFPQRRLDLTSAGLADQLSQLNGSLPLGFRYWPSGEIAAFNRPTFHIGLRQYSSRVQDYEYLMRSDGGAGGPGWNLAFGFTHVMRTDGKGSWYDTTSGRMLSAIDMEHLPGTTTRLNGHPVNPLFVPDPNKLTMSTTGYSLNYGTSDFAGGAGGKDGGIAGFVLVPKYGDFKAKKSVFFFPQGFWAIGSGISSTRSPDTESKHIQTTILQWACKQSRPEMIVNNRSFTPANDTVSVLDSVLWFHVQQENVSVVFNKPSRIYVRLKNHVLTAWQDHGTQPASAGYAYAVLPDITLSDTRNFVSNMPVRPERIDEKVHAVVNDADSSYGIVFFAPDSTLGIVASSPMIIYRQMADNGGILTMQNPLHTKKNIHFNIRGLGAPFRKLDSAIQVIPLASGVTRVEIATSLGRIYRLGYGTQASIATGYPRKNLGLSYYQDFQVEAKSDPQETILTVHLPDEAIRDGYRLSVHFAKSQQRYDFSAKDIIDRPSPNTVRYRWSRQPSKGPSVFAKYLKTNHGPFQVYLVTPSIITTDSFTVPEFKTP